MHWPSESKKYEGEFFSGKPIGKGVKTSPKGTKYYGYWAGGKFFEGEPPENEL